MQNADIPTSLNINSISIYMYIMHVVLYMYWVMLIQCRTVNLPTIWLVRMDTLKSANCYSLNSVMLCNYFCGILCFFIIISYKSLRWLLRAQSIIFLERKLIGIYISYECSDGVKSEHWMCHAASAFMHDAIIILSLYNPWIDLIYRIYSG